MNNVDLRNHFPLGTETITLVAASNRTNNSIALYKVNSLTRQLENVAARIITVGFPKEIYGLCMYHNPLTHQYYVFVNDKDGTVEQWEVFDNNHEKVDAKLVRRLSVGSQTEGCVADDELAQLYIGEENVGIWKYSADPNSFDSRTQIDTTDTNGI
ncbi:Phytase [Beggiatoa sp. PS]|nr:Phytase [Beggiatoa sp. PS]